MHYRCSAKMNGVAFGLYVKQIIICISNRLHRDLPLFDFIDLYISYTNYGILCWSLLLYTAKIIIHYLNAVTFINMNAVTFINMNAGTDMNGHIVIWSYCE